MEAAVQDDLHATINLGSSNGPRVDLLSNTSMNSGLKLLS